MFVAQVPVVAQVCKGFRVLTCTLRHTGPVTGSVSAPVLPVTTSALVTVRTRAGTESVLENVFNDHVIRLLLDVHFINVSVGTRKYPSKLRHLLILFTKVAFTFIYPVYEPSNAIPHSTCNH
jgi:hypothetical protein